MAIYMNKINRINAKERERERDESVTFLYRSIVLDNTAANITNLTFKGSWESELRWYLSVRLSCFMYDARHGNVSYKVGG